MLFLLQHYSYSVSDIKEPQPPPIPPPFGFDITQREKYSFHCLLYSWSIQALHIVITFYPWIWIILILQQLRVFWMKIKKGWECNLTFVLLIYLIGSSFSHCFTGLKYLSVCMSYLQSFFFLPLHVYSHLFFPFL